MSGQWQVKQEQVQVSKFFMSRVEWTCRRLEIFIEHVNSDRLLDDERKQVDKNHVLMHGIAQEDIKLLSQYRKKPADLLEDQRICPFLRTGTSRKRRRVQQHSLLTAALTSLEM
jgi:hypothetical protein